MVRQERQRFVYQNYQKNTKMNSKKHILKKACGKGGMPMPMPMPDPTMDSSMGGGAPPTMGGTPAMGAGAPPPAMPPMPPALPMAKPKTKTPGVGFLPHKKSIKHKLKAHHKAKNASSKIKG